MAASLSSHAAGTLFSGSIQYDNSASPNPVVVLIDPIGESDRWANSATKLSWEISYVGGALPWRYVYTWESSGQNLSHILIETSGNTVTADFNLVSGNVSFSGTNPTSQTEGSGNPDLPSTIFGLRFAGTSQDATWTLDSKRAPTWGDFYAKSGNNSGPAWNAGLTATDTDPSVDWAAFALGDLSTFQHDGPSRSIHIALPDTVETPIIPEPGTVAAGLGLGMLALGALIRRQR
ncbi:MAG: hypothetical protein ACKVYV_06720 [Limisphaerales bacterium]